MNITEITGMSDIELNTLFNAVVKERAHREENRKKELWNEFRTICTKIQEEGFNIEYYDECFDIDGINIC